MSKDVFEVYICKFENSVVYIGSGGLNRHKHCKSGISHVYELNEIHFSSERDKLSVAVVEFFNNKSDSLAYERDLVLLYQPTYNKAILNQSSYNTGAEAYKLLKQMLIEIENHELTGKTKLKLELLIREFFGYYRYNRISVLDIPIYNIGTYKKIDKIHLKNFSRFLRDENTTLYAENHYCKVFKNILKDVLGINISEFLVNNPKHHKNRK